MRVILDTWNGEHITASYLFCNSIRILITIPSDTEIIHILQVKRFQCSMRYFCNPTFHENHLILFYFMLHNRLERNAFFSSSEDLKKHVCAIGVYMCEVVVVKITSAKEIRRKLVRFLNGLSTLKTVLNIHFLRDICMYVEHAQQNTMGTETKFREINKFPYKFKYGLTLWFL